MKELLEGLMERWGRFPKIEYLPHEGILAEEVFYSEKLDGSNAGIVFDPEEGHVFVHGRRTPVAVWGGGRWYILNDYRGFVPYLQNLEGELGRVLSQLDAPLHVFGEWLIPHSVPYPAEMYGKFYVFPGQGIGVDLPFPKIEERRVPGPVFREGADRILDGFAGEVGRKFEGIVFHWWENGKVHRAKWTRREYRERLAVKWNQRGVITTPEIKMAAAIPRRSLVKVFEKVTDELGREPTVKDMPRLLGRLRQEFAEEWFWKAAKKTGWPTVDLGRLKREIDQFGRDVYLMRIETGDWPVSVKHGGHDASSDDGNGSS